jgi:type IV secretion system protein VirB11
LLRLYLPPLSHLLEASDTEDVAIQEPGVAWVLSRGKWRRLDIPELTLPALENLAVVAGSWRHMEALTTPIIDTDIPTGHRLNISAPPTVPEGTLSFTFRKPDAQVAMPADIPKRYNVDGWNHYRERSVAFGNNRDKLLALKRSGDIVAFLVECVLTRQNILMVGQTGVSKTSLAKTLISAIPGDERIISVEDSKELVFPQPNVVRLLFRRNDLLQHAIHADTLLQGIWRMRADRVILGEIRGREAWTFVSDVAPAHPGTISTIHGHSARSGFQRLYSYSQAATNMQPDTLARFVASSVDAIVPLHREGAMFCVDPVWFIGEAEERGETALDLLK